MHLVGGVWEMLLRPQKVVGYNHKNHLQHDIKIFKFSFIKINKD